MSQRQFRSDDTYRWNHGFGNGSDGDLSVATNTTDSPIDSSAVGAIGTLNLSATNPNLVPGQLILIHKTRGNTTTLAGTWELNKIVAYTPGTITLETPLCNSYQTDAGTGANKSQVIVMRQYENVTVNSGMTITAKAWNGSTGGILPYLVKNNLIVNGVINLSGRGFTGGFGQSWNDGGSHYSQSGEGTVGDKTQNSRNANGNGAGSAYTGSGKGAGGAGGGNATAGNAGNYDASPATSGYGGNAAGNVELTNAVFGGGGSGFVGWGSGQTLNSGGIGGGMLLAVARIITILGTVGANGSSGGITGWAGGGAGAGGSVLLKCVSASLGSSILTAVKGAGGYDGSHTNLRGGDGSDGRINVDYSTSVTGATNPTANLRRDLIYAQSAGGDNYASTFFWLIP